MDKINISVFGCCVSRDSVNADHYNVVRSVGFISPYTVLSGNCVQIDAKKLVEAGASRYLSRNISLDGSKSALLYLGEKKADWLLFDILDSRADILKLNDADSLITANYETKKYRRLIAEMVGSCEEVNRFSLSEELFEQRLLEELDELVKIYSPEKIIFHKTYAVDDYLSKEGKLVCFPNDVVVKNKKRNEMIARLSEVCERKLSGCHIINAPNGLFSDEEHIWEKHTLHYFAPYYEYVDKAICIIASKLAREREDFCLQSLFKEYNAKFSEYRKLIAENNKSAVGDFRKEYKNFFQTSKSAGTTQITTSNKIYSACSSCINAASCNGKCAYAEECYARCEKAERDIRRLNALLEEETQRNAAINSRAKEQENEINRINAKLADLNYVVRAEKKKRMATERELNAIVQSKSYKLGRALTWLPRKIRGVFRKK